MPMPPSVTRARATYTITHNVAHGGGSFDASSETRSAGRPLFCSMLAMFCKWRRAGKPSLKGGPTLPQ
jgi:hypothetical protein